MKLILGALGIAMSALIVWAMTQKSMGDSFGPILSDPWGIVAIADLYLGLLIIVGFVYSTCESKLKASIWSVLVLSFGNPISVLYILLYLRKRTSNET